MMFTRRFVTTFGLFLVLLLATSTVFAKGGKDFEPVAPRRVATIESCRSDNFNSSSGLWWYVLSAHKFDTDLSNPWDTNCSGCMDWKYETP